jgi:hypothetical protein
VAVAFAMRGLANTPVAAKPRVSRIADRRLMSCMAVSFPVSWPVACTSALVQSCTHATPACQSQSKQLAAPRLPNRVSEASPAVVKSRRGPRPRLGACVDGPSDARGKMRILTGRSIAIMCPAFSTRHHGRWPRWYPRSRPKHMRGFESRCTKRVLWIVGSTDCHLTQLFHPGINAWFQRPPADAGRPPHASSRPVPFGPSRCSVPGLSRVWGDQAAIASC